LKSYKSSGINQIPAEYSRQVVKVHEHNNSIWNKKKISIAIEESNNTVVTIKWLW